MAQQGDNYIWVLFPYMGWGSSHSQTLFYQCQTAGQLRKSEKCGKIKTLFSLPDHQFYHKWALLTDPDDITGGAKVGGF